MLQHPTAPEAPAADVGVRPSNDYGRDWPLHQRFDTADGWDDPLGCDGRPSWRGRVHLIGLCVAVPAMILLVVVARSGRARAGVVVYAACLCAMFTASTTYHRWVHALRLRASWRRADHAMIFAAIAGSTTPIVIIVMPSGRGLALLAVIWLSSCIGALMKLSRWARSDSVGTVMYAVSSVLGALVLPALWARGGVAPALCYIASGLLYVIGALWFSRTWPRLKPSVFSYHEVWHVFTVAAATAHFLAVWQIAA